MAYFSLYSGLDPLNIFIQLLLGPLHSILKVSYFIIHYTSHNVGTHTVLTNEHQDYQSTLLPKNNILRLGIILKRNSIQHKDNYKTLPIQRGDFKMLLFNIFL